MTDHTTTTATLLPAESIALTVGLAQTLRGDPPDPNVAAMCVLALARLAGRHDWTAEPNACGRPDEHDPHDGCAGGSGIVEGGREPATTRAGWTATGPRIVGEDDDHPTAPPAAPPGRTARVDLPPLLAVHVRTERQREASAQAAAAATRYAEAHGDFWAAVDELEAANREAREQQS